jgi:hypothetical protein
LDALRNESMIKLALDTNLLAKCNTTVVLQ